MNQINSMAFESPDDFRAWLTKNYKESPEIWLRIFKKDSGKATVTYAEALDEALCFGWIDGQKKPYDSQSWLQRFTPRKAKSAWSKINTQHAERLIAAGKMSRAGLEAVQSAKDDGRWAAAYDSSSRSEIPDEFLEILKRNKKAYSFFKTLNRTNLYSIYYRLQTAKKPETREKRMRSIIEMLEQGKTFH